MYGMTENENTIPVGEEGQMLSVWEAEGIAQRSALELEEAIDNLNGEPPDKKDRVRRHEDLVSEFMSLLASTYGLAVPDHAAIE